jgi:hypothetical protein
VVHVVTLPMLYAPEEGRGLERRARALRPGERRDRGGANIVILSIAA